MLCINTWSAITSKQVQINQPISQALKPEHTHELGWPNPIFKLHKKFDPYRLSFSPEQNAALAAFAFLIVWVVPPVIFWPLASILIKRSRVSKGLCHRCGYNCKGTISNDCPECGATRIVNTH
jgi:hypothetical protein